MILHDVKDLKYFVTNCKEFKYFIPLYLNGMVNWKYHGDYNKGNNFHYYDNHY